ncbi:MAG TPA: YceI family protein [Kofleriaceae bacterium]|nr:YceI family protein [Kofleriaceae bacterium]
MTHYRVDSAASRLLVQARSKIHDTRTEFTRITGEVDADPAALTERGASARFSVDMAAFDAGGWMKNKKLEKDLDLARHPQASFELRALRDVVRAADGGFTATAVGTLRYRGRELEVTIAGRGRIDDGAIEASGSFDLDIRQVGMEPPKFLVFKVEPEVTIEVTLRCRAG